MYLIIHFMPQTVFLVVRFPFVFINPQGFPIFPNISKYIMLPLVLPQVTIKWNATIGFIMFIVLPKVALKMLCP